MDSIRIKVNNLLRMVSKKNQTILPEHRLVYDLGMNSLALLEFIVRIEDEYNVSIPVHKISHKKRVKDLYHLVQGLDEFQV